MQPTGSGNGWQRNIIALEGQPPARLNPAIGCQPRYTWTLSSLRQWYS